MIMVVVATELKYRLAAFKVVALQHSGLFKLRQYSINRSQTNILTFIDKCFVNIFRRQMSHRATLEQAKYPQTWERGLQAHGLEVVWFAHG